MESDYEEDEEAEEEEESRDLSMWKITIPHVIMETKQVFVQFICALPSLLVLSKHFWDFFKLNFSLCFNSQYF